MSEPFRFFTRFNLVILLGRKAKTVRELLDGIREVPGASIYYHTHRFLQQHHYLSPEPPNDFAFWTAGSLGLDVVGERLASVDTIRFHRIQDLRKRIVEVLECTLETGKNAVQECPEGEEFHFMSCQTFIVPLPYEAHDVKEFLSILETVSINSLYFHIFESRLRLEKGCNDFSNWLETLGRKEAARAISRLDPYTITLEGLRKKIIEMVRNHA